MEKHFAIINKESDIVECIISVEDESAKPTEGYYEIKIPFHNVDIFGKKYVNGEFIEVDIENENIL